ncbi:MAG: histone deacetylase [Cyanobacteriota bacterium]|nr:histone deacetylase [Cyanobacteriota bacterium]
MARTGLVWEPRCLLHQPGVGHPECPQRLEAIRNGLEQAGLWQRCEPLAARPATDSELLRCHTKPYLKLVSEEIAAGRRTLSTGDTSLSPDTEDAARLAAGGALVAAEAVMDGRLENAFVAVRPPGHHASSDQGMGFCLFNNVALAARHAQVALGCDRVLIVDWDVHHGNGTQALFWRDPSVLFFSVHQAPFYPGSGAANERGAGPGLGFTINCPLPAGSGGKEVLAALQEHLVPAAEAFRPSLVLLSSGFDGMAGDPLAHLQLKATDVADLTLIVKTLAARTAEGRLVSLLEGGYGLGNLARGAAAHVEALLVG